MSIPSADHTIYSFITLCLKEQGDIAGKKEITASPVQGRWKKKNRMPSSAETYLCDRFMVQKPGFYFGGGGGECGCSHPSASTPFPPYTSPPPPPIFPTCATHTFPHPAVHENPAPCGLREIQFMIYPWRSDLLYCSHANPSQHAPPPTPSDL